MATGPSHIVEFLARADAERDAGRGAEAARLYAQAAVVARRDGDDDAWAGAVLGAASVQVFGTEPGNLPPLLYDVLVRTTDDALRSRLAAALTRCWVYAGEAGRAAHFSQEAVERARTSGDPNLLANALDAALAAHWGPDDLEMRQALAGELDDVAAHVVEPEARLQAHLWGLQVACEVLDVQGMHRQVRALERLGEESPKARFFAASRRLMLDLLRGRTDSSAHLLAVAGAAAEESFIPDAWMVLAALDGYSAVQSGDVERVTSVACAAEAFAVEEGVTAVCAEAAYWFAAAGDVERAGALVRTFDGGVLQNLPRDVNWLLTLQCVLEAALAVGDANIIELAVTLLLPYAGRSVVNGGAVMFHGTTDDTLSRALTVQGCSSEAEELRARALAAYERIGARWWWKRLKESSPTGSSAAVVDGALSLSGRRVRLHPSAGGLWLVGTEGAPMAGLRGLEYVRELVCRPWQPVPALDLVGSRGAVVEESGLGEVVDRQAIASYRQRIHDLDAEIGEAQEWNDLARIEAARLERDALLDEISRASGLGGRPRTTGSSQERARVAVRKAIATAIRRIGGVDEQLALHLRNSIRTGLACSYEPESGTMPDWVLGPDRSLPRTGPG